MASSIVGNLIVRLAADIGSYESGLRKADKESKRRLRTIERRVKSFERNFSRSMKAAAGGVSLVSGALAIMVAKQSEAFKQTDATAQSLDMQTGKLQQWQYAAQRVGVDAGKMGDIFKDTADKIGDFAATGGGEAKDLFENLSLDIEKLRKLRPDEQLLAIGEAISQIEDPSKRVFYLESIADDASRLLPLLDEGGKKFRELAKEAREVGAAQTPEQIEQLREANDAIGDLKGTYDGLSKQITAAAVPAIDDFTEALTDEDVQRGLSTLVNGLIKTVEWLARSGSALSNWAADVGSQFSDRLGTPIERAQDRIKQIRAELDGLQGDLAAEQYGPGAVHNTAPSGDRRKRLEEELDLQKRILADAKDQKAYFDKLYENSAPSSKKEDDGKPVKLDTDPGGTDQQSAIEGRIESLQKEMALFGDLSRVEEARISIANGYYGDVTAAQEQMILGLSKGLDQKDADKEADEKSKSAIESVTAALATQQEQVWATFQTNQQAIAKITDDEAKQAELRARNWEQLTEGLSENTDQLSIFAERASENVQDFMGDQLERLLAGNFDNIEENFAAMLSNMAAEAAAARLSSYIFGDGVGGGGDSGLFGSIAGAIGTAAGAWFGGGGASPSTLNGMDPTTMQGLSGINVPGLATGGPAGPGSIHEVAERGPEVLNSGGKSYLLMGQEGGHVSPAVSGWPAAMSNAAGGVQGRGDVVVNITNKGQPLEIESQQRRQGADGTDMIDLQVKGSISRMVQTGEMDDVLGDLAGARQGKTS